MGSGPSPPTMPLANTFNAEVDDEVDVDGAKAVAVPAMVARMVAVSLAMVTLVYLSAAVC